jgi:hypothetical protein
MRHIKSKVLALAVSLALASFPPAALAADKHLSYELEKLDGLGYIRSMRTGAKPYTQMQAAGWIKEAADRVKTNDAQYVIRC